MVPVGGEAHALSVLEYKRKLDLTEYVEQSDFAFDEVAAWLCFVFLFLCFVRCVGLRCLLRCACLRVFSHLCLRVCVGTCLCLCVCLCVLAYYLMCFGILCVCLCVLACYRVTCRCDHILPPPFSRSSSCMHPEAFSDIARIPFLSRVCRFSARTSTTPRSTCAPHKSSSHTCSQTSAGKLPSSPMARQAQVSLSLLLFRIPGFADLFADAKLRARFLYAKLLPFSGARLRVFSEAELV